jgi:hypothetical protein
VGGCLSRAFQSHNSKYHRFYLLEFVHIIVCTIYLFCIRASVSGFACLALTSGCVVTRIEFVDFPHASNIGYCLEVVIVELDSRALDGVTQMVRGIKLSRDGVGHI